MRILAVDPGTVQSAFVVWDGAAVLIHEILTNTDLVERLEGDDYSRWMFKNERGMPERCSRPTILVLEAVESFGMAVGKEVFETVFWSGRFAQAWHHRTFARMSRRGVKLHICGHARATDANIRQALIDRIGPIGTKKNQGPLYGLKGHEFAALAVAVTYYDQHSGEIRPGVEAQF